MSTLMLPRRWRDLLLALLLVGLPLLLLRAQLRAPGELNGFDRLLLRAAGPLERAVASSAEGVQRWWRRYFFLVHVEGENEALRAERQQLRFGLQQARRELRIAARYERLLAFRQRRGLETVSARVIGRPPSAFARALRLYVDRGGELLRRGMPVVTDQGVVGRVGRVFGDYAEVTLLVDPKSAVDVVLSRSGARGLLRGADGSDGYRCRLDYVLRRETVKTGDWVVTSGAAGLFPEGLVVGRVSRVGPDEGGLYREVDVTPAMDFGELKEVLVIAAPAPAAVGEAAPAIVPARGLAP
ncbi:MAG: rod shape-determining protein MreC [Proteobacteria bacterium]|nr:rod shape-determining protein MreC [Pseudomonadota bacterium]